MIDNAKAIGIILVVFGHAAGLPDTLNRCIFSFHMPLFFFLSGALLSKARQEVGVFTFLRQRGRAIFVPYTLFFVLSWAYWLATLRIGHRATKFAGVGWEQPWKGYFTGLSSDLVIVNPTLWFFPCLFFVMLYYHVARRLVARGVATVGFGLVTVVSVVLSREVNILSFRLPMGIDVACVATGFYAVGQQMRRLVTVTMSDTSRVFRAALLAIAAGCFSATWPLNGSVDMQAQKYGSTSLLFLCASLSGIGGIVLLASLLPSSAAASWLSEHTLLIFPTHTLVFVFLSGASQRLFDFAPSSNARIGYALSTTALALLFAVPTVAILRRLRTIGCHISTVCHDTAFRVR